MKPIYGLALLMAAAAAGHATARTLEVGAGRPYKQPSDAIAAAQSGDRILIAPGEYFDCATVRAPNLVIEGQGGDAAKVVMTDKACGGKGLLIVQGDNLTLRNLTLTRARVPDGNGAGIRGESPNLTVDGVRFVNNQNGILDASPDSTLVVRNSLFDRNGACSEGQGCAHGIYVGGLKRLTVENSRFTGTKEGHHIKSRAARTEVIDSTIEDGPDGTASYLIDISNGGAVVLRGNTMEKGPHAQNHSAAVAIGAEGVTQPTPEITVENNSFRNDMEVPTVFVNNLTATEAVLRNNRLSGQVRPLKGDGSVK